LQGYGAMNAPGLPLTIGMVLAKEAGVNHADLDLGISRGAKFLRWFTNKGAIPYGDHQPFFAHEDNGKCAAGALLFDLLGDAEAAGFYAKMAAAGYSERERGHTGNFFNMLWAMLGVSRCGPMTTGAYQQEQSWYYDLARSWDGKFRYQGSPGGEEESGAYRGWDCSGSYLLGYALPLKMLRITGKKCFTLKPLTAEQTADVIATGRDFSYRDDPDFYEQRSDAQLLAGLASWSPFVRGRSATALGKREGQFLPQLLPLLTGESASARYGAIVALGALGKRSDAAAPQLRALLKHDDTWTRCLAAEAMPSLGKEARKSCVSDLLALIVTEHAADPRRQAARSASFALFAPFPGTRGPRSILADSLEGVNHEQLVPALRTLLAHEDSIPRGSVRSALPRLSDADILQLLPDVVRAVERAAPSNEMFANGVRIAGLDLLSRLHIEEGLALCITAMEPENWGERERVISGLRFLVRYGTHAKSQLPKLQEIRRYLMEEKNRKAKDLEEMDALMAEIEKATETPTLVKVADFRAKP
jgi:HEAT repeat protein